MFATRKRKRWSSQLLLLYDPVLVEMLWMHIVSFFCGGPLATAALEEEETREATPLPHIIRRYFGVLYLKSQPET